MKKVLKKIYDVLPNGIKKLYWQTRKKVGQILMFRIVFPVSYTHLAVPEEETAEEKKDGPLLLMNFEPEPEEVLDAVIPKYINSVIYGGMMDAVASENGARMTAMDNATSNAEDMIENLTLSYNSCLLYTSRL